MNISNIEMNRIGALIWSRFHVSLNLETVLNTQPIWRMVQDAARELTRDGAVPFSRIQIIEKINGKFPKIDSNSINPMIQGLTDNLRGGAPVTVGKRVLHSVGRGRFVLYSTKDKPIPGSKNALPDSTLVSKPRSAFLEADSPRSENELRDQILGRLQKRLTRIRDIELMAEGRLPYLVDVDHQIFHSSDILAKGPNERYVSVELKYKSAVTDQFKCRAYDAMHMKRHYGDNVLCVMLYLKSTSGISLNQARRISYPFDSFIGMPVEEIAKPDALDQLEGIISDFFA